MRRWKKSGARADVGITAGSAACRGEREHRRACPDGAKGYAKIQTNAELRILKIDGHASRRQAIKVRYWAAAPATTKKSPLQNDGLGCHGSKRAEGAQIIRSRHE